MRKIVLGILIGILALPSLLLAQRSEVGVFAGSSFYLGDLNRSQLFSQSRPAFGAMYRYNLTTRWTLRGNLLSGMITADDAKFDNPRNLNFRSQIHELSVQGEISFLPYFTGSDRHRFTPYLFGGVAMFAFNPQAFFYDSEMERNRWVDLAPLSTEGQGLSAYPDKKRYRTTQLSFPFGLGFRYSLNATFSIGVEWGMRKTFTDYLDDVSGTYVDLAVLAMEIGPRAAELSDRSYPLVDLDGNRVNPVGSARGSANKTDWYSFAGITLTAKVGKGRAEPCPANQKSAVERIRSTQRLSR